MAALEESIARVRGAISCGRATAIMDVHSSELLAVCDAAARTAEVERERKAYKRAKAENDERFMLELGSLRTLVENIERLVGAGAIFGCTGIGYCILDHTGWAIWGEAESLAAAVQAAIEELDR